MNPSFQSVRSRFCKGAATAAAAVLGLGLAACGGVPEASGPDEVAQVTHGLTAGESAFDPSSCTGAALTRAGFIAKFAPGTNEVKLGTYELYQRKRRCNPVTGCSAWGSPAQPETGGLEPQPIGGTFSLGINSSGELRVQVRDRSIYNMTGKYPDFLGVGTSTLTYREGGNYRYEWVDQWVDWSRGYPIPVGERFRVCGFPEETEGYPHHGADFKIAAITDSCVRIVSTADAQETNQFALLVRY